MASRYGLELITSRKATQQPGASGRRVARGLYEADEFERLRRGQGHRCGAHCHQSDLPGSAKRQGGNGVETWPAVQRVAGIVDGDSSGF